MRVSASSVGEFDNISVRELPGNHAYQSTTTSRPTLSARYNLLTKSEQFDDAAWVKIGVTAPSAAVLQDTAITSFHFVDRGVTIAFTSGVSYTLRARLEKGTIGFAGIHIYDGTPRGCSIDLTTGQLGTPYGGAAATAVADGTGWILTVTATAGATTAGSAAIYMSTSNALATYAGSGSGTIYVSNADLRVANDGVGLPAYQRVNTASDFAVDGFPAAEVFDGTDDNQITAAGGGSTTAFFWCSSIRVGKVGAVQTLFSDTGTNTGYRVRINASNQLELAAGNGSAYTTATTSDTLALGQRAVLTAWHDGANLNVQINNGTVVQTAFATATAGTAQITIGKDNNAASSYFMGRLYEKVYLKDTVVSASNITATKNYCANKAKITL